ncbi:hypothetical protein [Piscinibacter sp.]|uniref:hypothetical protein n=1 Tax=Piscinibacter sp. TaxID=1903157 RepID=UPI0039E42B14
MSSTTAEQALTKHDDAVRKRIATVEAQLALKGFELHRTPIGMFIVCKWGLTRELRLDEVETFARRVGA